MSQIGKIYFDVRMELPSYPTKCSECPAFYTTPYICHNERGYTGHCYMGCMSGFDTRDFYGHDRHEGCFIENDTRVKIIKEK